MAQKKKRVRRKRVSKNSRGLTVEQMTESAGPEDLREIIEADGGAVIGVYRDPLGGYWQALAALPIHKVEPTPFQRDLSDAHVKRMVNVIDDLDRFLDPIIVVRHESGRYWTPNGNHRLSAMKKLGGRSITALVLPEHEIAYKILALNTEKAHNVKEKSLEVIRMARSLADLDPQPEKNFGMEFEEPAFLTLGICYEGNKRFSGSAYQSILKRIEDFMDEMLPKAIKIREKRAAKLVKLDEHVVAAVAALKAKGFDSPYLKAFVISRINFLRFVKKKLDWDEAMDKVIEGAKKFSAEKVKPEQVAKTSGGSGD